MNVSIITPSFNQGRFLERTLNSVASQSGADIEHVVFDGGSTDNTVEVLGRFQSPLRWVSKQDKGQTDAVNQGIRSTGGEIIGWLNSDDIYYPGAIARVVAFFTDHPEVDVVYGMADHIDADDGVLGAYPTEPWDMQRLKEACFICQPALFFRRRVVERCGLLDESLNYCMDYEFWLRLGRQGVRFAYLQEKLAGSRLYPETKTQGQKLQVCEEILRMFRNTLGSVPDAWLLTYAHALVAQRRPEPVRRLRDHLQVAAYSVGLSLKWNRKISGALLRILYAKAAEKLGRG